MQKKSVVFCFVLFLFLFLMKQICPFFYCQKFCITHFTDGKIEKGVYLGPAGWGGGGGWGGG